MAFIQVIEPESADGKLKEVYEYAAGRRGRVANVLQIHSLKPETLRTHLDFYMSILYGSSGLSRREREVIATAVSRANQCEYCVAHHGDALSRYAKDEGLVQTVMADGWSDALTEREKALVEYARKLTTQMDHVGPNDLETLRRVGLDDEQILCAVLTISYFNFVNRNVVALGVDLEEKVRDPAYKY